MSQPLTIILGAGPGLGLALARRFANEGHDLALMARDEDRLSKMAETVAKETGQTVKGFTADGTDLDSIRGALTRIHGSLGPTRVFIHNASRWLPDTGPELAPDLLMSEMMLGAGAALAASQAVLPGMEAAGEGTILWTGSRMGLAPAEAGAPSPALAAGKSALRGLALATAGQFHDRGVNFSTITINGGIGSKPAFAPDKIADVFWQAHKAPRSEWTAERIFDGAD